MRKLVGGLVSGVALAVFGVASLAAQGAAGTAPGEFRARFTAELEKWRKVVRAAHIELE